MVEENILKKGKKYMLQFPDGTSSEHQKEYLNTVDKAFETEDRVSIDPKIKIFPKYEEDLIVTDGENNNTNSDETGSNANQENNTSGSGDTAPSTNQEEIKRVSDPNQQEKSSAETLLLGE